MSRFTRLKSLGILTPKSCVLNKKIKLFFFEHELFEKRTYLYIKGIIMSKQKHIKIPLPNWKWWQMTIAIVVIILAFRINAAPAFELLKIWLKSYLAR